VELMGENRIDICKKLVEYLTIFVVKIFCRVFSNCHHVFSKTLLRRVHSNLRRVFSKTLIIGLSHNV